MIVADIATATGLLGGGFLGRRLAARGITAQNALVGRQKQRYIVLAIVASVFGGIYFGPEITFFRIIPDSFVVYGEELASPAMTGEAVFVMRPAI